MDHFKDDFGLYLLRHPVSHAFSRMRKGWDEYNDLYAGSQKIKFLLSGEAKSKVREVLASGSHLEKFVLSWCLENYVFIYKLQSGSLPDRVFSVFYEELVESPEKTIRDICQKVNMDYNEQMLSRMKAPSSGIVHSAEEAEAQIIAGNTGYLTERWKERMDEASAEKVKDILSKLGITIYKDF
jgi:fructose-1-phosphate kinase PfkB-like protein